MLFVKISYIRNSNVQRLDYFLLYKSWNYNPMFHKGKLDQNIHLSNKKEK